jgi:hypothetical protein
MDHLIFIVSCCPSFVRSSVYLTLFTLFLEWLIFIQTVDPMVRASLLFYILTFVHFFVYIQLTHAILYYQLNGELQICRTYEAYFGRPIPYKINGVFIHVERSKEVPCKFTISNNTLGWVDKYQLKSRYSHMILATEDVHDLNLTCHSFSEVHIIVWCIIPH